MHSDLSMVLMLEDWAVWIKGEKRQGENILCLRCASHCAVRLTFAGKFISHTNSIPVTFINPM